MKKHILKFCLFASVMALAAQATYAQQSRNSQQRQTSVNNASQNPALQQAPQDTVPEPKATLEIAAPTPSLRNDNAIQRNLVKDRTPLDYEHIREDDAVYMQRVWREIDIQEKINLPFAYKAQSEFGDQRFITILLRAIRNGEITAFSAAGGDDRFTTPLTWDQIAELLVGAPERKQIPDWVNDPDGSKGLKRDTVISAEFNPDLIQRYWIKEDVIFDKESSRMYTRILGIAPVKTITNDDGSFRAVTPVFWVYYPDLRPMLAQHEVYNGKNYGARMSWEELFESRMFGSRIIKSTINNPNDMFINGYIKDPILALLEGENIKEKIFNYEQDLWSY